MKIIMRYFRFLITFLIISIFICLSSCSSDNGRLNIEEDRKLVEIRDLIRQNIGVDNYKILQLQEDFYYACIFITNDAISFTEPLYCVTSENSTVVDYIVFYSEKKIYKNLGTDPALCKNEITRYVFCKMFPTNYCAEGISKINKEYNELTKILGSYTRFQILGEITDRTTDTVTIWGQAFPINGEYSLYGTIMEKANICVINPLSVGFVANYYSGYHYFIEKGSGVNAFGIPVPVWIYGDSLADIDILSNEISKKWAILELLKKFNETDENHNSLPTDSDGMINNQSQPDSSSQETHSSNITSYTDDNSSYSFIEETYNGPMLAITECPKTTTIKLFSIKGNMFDKYDGELTVNGHWVCSYSSNTEQSFEYSTNFDELTEGENIFVLVLTNSEGKSTTVTKTIIYNIPDPILTITECPTTTTSKLFSIKGKMLDKNYDGELTVNGHWVCAYSSNTEQSFEYSTNFDELTEGENVFVLVLTNSKGKSTTVTKTIIYNP